MFPGLRIVAAQIFLLWKMMTKKGNSRKYEITIEISLFFKHYWQNSGKTVFPESYILIQHKYRKKHQILKWIILDWTSGSQHTDWSALASDANHYYSTKTGWTSTTWDGNHLSVLSQTNKSRHWQHCTDSCSTVWGADLALILCQSPPATTLVQAHPRLRQRQCGVEESSSSGIEFLWWQTVGVGNVE